MKRIRVEFLENWVSLPKKFLGSNDPDHLSPTFYQYKKHELALPNIQIVFRADENCFWAVFENPEGNWGGLFRKLRPDDITVRFYTGADYLCSPVMKNYSASGNHIALAMGSLPESKFGGKFIDNFAMSKSIDVLSEGKVIFSSKTAPVEDQFGSWQRRQTQANLLEDGGAISADAKAMVYCLLAAEQGDARAQAILGFMYVEGKGVLQDYAEAMKWYRLAAEQGYASAQHSLGYMYDNGQGVPQDSIMAHMWYNIGAANGDKLGGDDRDKLAKIMSSQDISKAQTMARECMSSGYTKCGY